MSEPTIDAILAAIRETSAAAPQGEWRARRAVVFLEEEDETWGVASAWDNETAAHIAATQPARMAPVLAYIDDLAARADRAEATAQALAATLGAYVEALAERAEKAERERDEAYKALEEIASAKTSDEMSDDD